MKDCGRIPVAVLGATGVVGERLIDLLSEHPWFRLAAAVASDASAGDRLGGRRGPGAAALPADVEDIRLQGPDEPLDTPLVLSALPSAAARDVEARLAGAGHLVVSNASAFRADADVPLVVPEVNPDHLELLQAQAGRWPGGIVTNPNCSVAGLVVALAPLQRAFGLESVVVTTLQAISGAGRPGPAAADLVDNVLPFIAGEEQKLEVEPRKILGTLTGTALAEASFRVTATCTRVGVLHGHLEVVAVRFRRRADAAEARSALESFANPVAELGLPSAPPRPLELVAGPDRPQPRLDRERGSGMTVSIGRLRNCAVHDVRFVVLSHNLMRGAAGAALLNAELACSRGLVPGVSGPPSVP